jgi:hypothetical protein
LIFKLMRSTMFSNGFKALKTKNNARSKLMK